MTDNMTAIVEALIFAAEQPISVEQIKALISGSDTAQIRQSIEQLSRDYENSGRGVRIDEVAGGYRMTTASGCSGFVRKLYRQRRSDRLSRQSMETLAIIAYKQPVTKQEIQSLRSVNIDGVMKSLQERNLIKITGKKETPGRPYVFGTGKQFLEYFGLKSIEDLPKLDSIEVGADILAGLQQPAALNAPEKEGA